MSKFSSQVSRSNNTYEFLPLFHTCEAFQARSYIEDRCLTTTDICEVFEEPITYLFYGRPAYKYAMKDGSTTNLASYPICFVFDIDLLPEIKRIYPFDTGALHHKFLNNFIHDNNVVAHFELEPERNRIADVVLHFHGTNENYLAGKLKPREHDPFHFESISYAKMHENYVPDRSDERRITMEVHAPQSLQLKKGALKAVILPTPMLGSQFFKAFIEESEVDVRSYDIDMWDPIYSFATVATTARKYIAEEAAVHAGTR